MKLQRLIGEARSVGEGCARVLVNTEGEASSGALRVRADLASHWVSEEANKGNKNKNKL
jgi:hypothetical protein